MIAQPAKVRDGNKEMGTEGGQEPRLDPKRLGGLVLARQLGESIMIGDAVLVEVLGLKSNSVRLRVVAPRSVAVHRREVYDAIRLAPGADVVRPVVEGGLAAFAGQPIAADEGGLVLTRRTGQTIMIGDEVAIDVVEARPGTTRLRVIAPRSISVHRREVYDAIRGGDIRTQPVSPGTVD